MSIKQAVQQKLKESMKARDTHSLNACKQIKTEIMKLETSGKSKEVSDGDIIKVLKSLVKQHKESIEAYQNADRAEAAETEQAELDTILSFMPPMLEEAQLQAEIDNITSAMEQLDPSSMGSVMKSLRERLAGKEYDGKTLSDMVKNKLNS